MWNNYHAFRSTRRGNGGGCGRIRRKRLKWDAESLQIEEADEQQILPIYDVLSVFSINMLNRRGFNKANQICEFVGRSSQFVRPTNNNCNSCILV